MQMRLIRYSIVAFSALALVGCAEDHYRGGYSHYPYGYDYAYGYRRYDEPRFHEHEHDHEQRFEGGEHRGFERGREHEEHEEHEHGEHER